MQEILKEVAMETCKAWELCGLLKNQNFFGPLLAGSILGNVALIALS